MSDQRFKKPEKRKVMFGKYAGWLYKDVPNQYLAWFVKNAYPQMRNRKAWAIEELRRRGLYE